jgi:DNA modification methylase
MPVEKRKLLTMPLAELVPYEKNPRTHSPEQIAALRASIRKFDFTRPILVNPQKRVLVGHGAREAAIAEGRRSAPVLMLWGLTDAEERAYIIADNQLAMQAGWDDDLLRQEIEFLEGEGFDLDVLGFSADELADIRDLEGDNDQVHGEDTIPDVPVVPVSRAGDLWLLGPHRLLCGDSTDSQVVKHVLDGKVPHLMVTDPPSGVEYDANWRNEADRSNGKPIGARAVGVVQNDDRADWRAAWRLFPGDVCYVWHGGLHASRVQQSLEACNFEVRAQIIWAKTRHVISRGHYHWQHEPCFYAVRSGANGHWTGARDQTTLWTIEHSKSDTGHSTQKPVEAMRKPIENNSEKGEGVYEPFSGSGTTIIACERMGRICFAIELNPAYVDVALRRWEQFTGQVAKLEGADKTLADVQAERK